MYNTFAELEKLATFIPEEDNTYLDIVEEHLEEGTRLVSRAGGLEHSQIDDYLSGAIPVHDKGFCITQGAVEYLHDPDAGAGGPVAKECSTPVLKPEVIWTLRLLLGSPSERSVDGLRHFPFSRSTLRKIQQKFDLPEAFLGYLAAQTPLTTRFRTSKHSSGLLAILNRRALIITHNTEKRVTFALVIGLCPHEIGKFVAEAKASVCLNASVIRVAAAWLNVIAETRARRLVERKLAVTELEKESGSHWSDGTRFIRPLRSIDFEATTRKLTIFMTQLAFDEVAIEQVDRLLQKLKTFQDEYVKDCCRSGNLDKDEFRLPFEQAEELLFGLRNATKMIRDRGNVQLQTIYSLVAQRDNELNFKLAVDSHTITQASRSDNIIMKQLAADSREIAKRTYMDSVSMRLMAFINLCTMPGTFTATFFSTGFFDFKPSQPDSIVSSWVWLYWAVTGMLTVLMLVPLWWLKRDATKKLEKPGGWAPRSSIDTSDGEFGEEFLKTRVPTHNQPIITQNTTMTVHQTREETSSQPAQSTTLTVTQQQEVTQDPQQENEASTVKTIQEATPPLPEGTEPAEKSPGKLLSGPLAIEEGSLFTTPGLRFENSCRVCACPLASSMAATPLTTS